MTNGQFRRRRIGKTLGLLVMSLALLASGHSATATNGAHPDSETPGSRFLVVFSPAYEEPLKRQEVEAVVSRAVEHNYYPLYFLNVPPESQPAPTGYTGYTRATADIFKDILNGDFVSPGILFVMSHGDTDVLLIEAQPGEDECNNRVRDYVRRGVFADGELRCVQSIVEPNPWGIAITGPAITRYFRDNNTIVHISACNSWSLADDFITAREFFGVEGCQGGDASLRATTRLWGRLHGEIENGRMRPATVAGAGLGFLMHQHRAGTLDTVLSPAVKKHIPEKEASFVVPLSVEGSVLFDTRMDVTVDPATAISVSGCDARIKDPIWASAFELRFDLELNTPGTGTLKVHEAAARAERKFKNNLDGNTRWRDGLGDIQENLLGGEDHIGPNRDDFVWMVQCEGASIPHFLFKTELKVGESTLLRPDTHFQNFWDFVAQGRKVTPISVVQVCILGTCANQISGGIDGVKFVLAPTGIEAMGLTSTALPTGLQLSETSGVIHGSAAQAGTTRPLIRAVDTQSDSPIAELWLELDVIEPLTVTLMICAQLFSTLQEIANVPISITPPGSIMHTPVNVKVPTSTYTLSAPKIIVIGTKTHSFKDWTKQDGTVISNDSTFNLTVTGDLLVCVWYD